jgi:hypothetical protein
MPDFDANDDLTRPPGPGQGGSSDRAAFQPPASRRGREQVRRHPSGARRATDRRIRAGALIARRRAHRAACPTDGRALRALTPSRQRLRSTSLCRGRLPGSLS